MTLNIDPAALPVEYVPLPVTPMIVEPVTLTGTLVELSLMTQAHLDELAALGTEKAIWEHYTATYETREKMAAYIDQCAAEQARGVSLPFVIKDRSTGKLVGGTRYLNIDRANHHLEIGSSWLHPQWQRTGINTEAKYLLLTHAFETLNALRVELKTDAWNAKSRAAMERIGAQYEGTFRYHMIRHDGRIRHSAYYAFVRPDWPATKAHIEGLMRR
jgi:N-acetyltransferase